MESDKVVGKDVAVTDEGKVVADDGAVETDVVSDKIMAGDGAATDEDKVVADDRAV